MVHHEHSLIWDLYLEGAAEDMIMSSLKKQQASPQEISLFTRKENGKLLFRPDHVTILLNWIRAQHADIHTMEDDYKNYLKYFPNVKMQQFDSYINWTERVHAKRDESLHQSRHKDTTSMDIQGEDQKNVLADDEHVLILRGDDEHACVRYGRGYSFCISRPGGGNMYGTYRLSKASTFYFVFFKKIPKDDERHIMVLDHTAEGWEWTFGKNRTQEVAGGWDEIESTFPELKKYKNLFVNKPLTSQEKSYQEQLQQFIHRPSKQQFDQFSYSQQADVLKFGSRIPLDVFNSLDKFLRNEWVSVGPKMSDDIYEQLTTGERDRFTKVRAQQLTQRDPKDKYDVDVCKNDPELFTKHLAADEKLSKREQKKINSKIINGTYDGDIKIQSKYYFPNLDSLKILNGWFQSQSATLHVNFPQLQKCVSLYLDTTFDLNLPKLQECDHIGSPAARSINSPQLLSCKKVQANGVSILHLPRLQQCREIIAPTAHTVDLAQLQQCDDIHVDSVEELSLPKLQECKEIHASEALSINLPRLQKVSSIYAASAKRIVVRQAIRSKLRWSTIMGSNLLQDKDCEIIEPDAHQLNDSMLQDLMKKYLLSC